MKIIVSTKKSPENHFLVSIDEKGAVKEVKDLLGKGKYKKASTFVLNEGKVEREVLFDDLSGVKADLILTEKNARWDLL
jgi:hypothetical protein